MSWRMLAVAIALAIALAPIAASAPAPAPVCTEDACRIEHNSAAYIPPVAVVPEGAAVTFASLDTTHVTADGISPGFSCLFATSSPGTDSEATTFTADQDTLYGTSTSSGTVACATAIALPNGDFALPYHCTLHPQMRAMLVITAAP